MEIKEIPEYPGFYATDTGIILSMRSGRKRILSQTLHKGYYRVHIKALKNIWIRVPVHQLVLFAFYGPKPFANAVCRHLNGNPTDNRSDNLKWGTAKENVHDSISQGTAACLRHGETAIASKLTERQVLEIERRAKHGELERDLAAEFGIDQKHVSEIKLHQTWKRLWVGGCKIATA
jgi:hypothetical protein